MATTRKPNAHETHRILLIESDQHDAERVAHALRYNSHYPEIRRVESVPELAEALETFEPDVVLSGHADVDAREALNMSPGDQDQPLKIAQKLYPNPPGY
jgi:hypothetical protein